MAPFAEGNGPALFAPLPRPWVEAGGARPDPQSGRTSRSAAATSLASKAVASFGRLRVSGQQIRWGAFGFVAGAVFWHFVGFWSFMAHIMFSTPETARTAQTPAATSVGPGAMIETGSLQRLERLTAPKIEPGCSALSRYPQTGLTSQSECRKLARALRHNPSSGRQDLKAVPAREVQNALDPAWPQPEVSHR